MTIPENDCDDLRELRIFGRALVRDERHVLTDGAAAQLVERLIRQTLVGAVDGDGQRAGRDKVATHARFVDLHRRHVRKFATEESESGWSDGGPPGGEKRIAYWVRALPLEQREAILVVTLAGFTHREAAQALGLSLAQMIDRLDKARERLAASVASQTQAERAEGWDRPPHLRVVK